MTERSATAAPEPPAHRRLELILALAAIGLIAIAWVAGGQRARTSRLPVLQETMPAAAGFTRLDDAYQAWSDEGHSGLLGYVAFGTAAGYGGPLTVAVAIDTTGVVLNVVIADHKESPAWLDRVAGRGLPGVLAGKRYDDAFAIGQDLDAVTGATMTTRALGQAVLEGSRTAALASGLPLPQQQPVPLRFGPLEIVTLLLLATVLASFRVVPRNRKLLRWGTLLTGLIVLGFIYNSPLTLTYFVRAILGYWPAWRTEPHFYMLVVGIPLIILLTGKNPYCHWFCPFGAAQKCLGLAGGAGHREPRRMQRWLVWLPRGLALGAVLVGVYHRSPGLAGYELFGTLFALVGGSVQFIALGLVILAALFIARPWCRYLCPVGAILDLVRMVAGLKHDRHAPTRPCGRAS
jgi:NosR/NirI family transcriptional regulator, nitrous oxide reductase regulator